MSADYLNALTAALQMLEKIGAWPLVSIFLAIAVGPWIMAFILARGQERRFEAMKEMYLSNAKLVKGYEKLCQSEEERGRDLRTIIMMNTQAMTRLTDVIQAGRS